LILEELHDKIDTILRNEKIILDYINKQKGEVNEKKKV